MRKRLMSLAVVLAILNGLSGIALADGDERTPPEPTSRSGWIAPQPPGTKTTVRLQWGPYVVHPGTDMWRPHGDVTLTDGFITALRASARLADGSEPAEDQIHIHHGGFFLRGAPFGWLLSTGEEQTHIDLERTARADPRYPDGLRYGIETHGGWAIYGVSMLHNKSAQPFTVWLQLEIDFVHGTRDAIKQAAGLNYHPITPGLSQVAIFHVPRAGRPFAYPRDLGTGKVGQLWTVPQDGAIVFGAAHLHPGGVEVRVSNLGPAAAPCPDEGDGFEGTTVARLAGITRSGVQPSYEFQVGVTKPGWRLKVRKGDRIAINAVYAATDYGYMDAMDAFGHWFDADDVPAEGESTCSAVLVDEPGAEADAIAASVPNRPWHGTPQAVCVQCDDLSAPQPPLGPHANVVNIAGFQYAPGDQATVATTGAPWVRKGETITFVNEDWGALIRHTASSCKSPCNGPTRANYPFSDRVFDSGVLGSPDVPLPIAGTSGFISAHREPIGSIDTSQLAQGYYAYYCRLHPWMRGSFYVVE